MMMAQSRQSFSRVDRVRKAVLREMGDILANELQDPRLDDQIISVTDVEVSNDLRHAKVFFSILADEETRNELMTLILDYAPKIRQALGQRVQLRYVPELHLFLDDSLERGTRVSALLNKLSSGEIE